MKRMNIQDLEKHFLSLWNNLKSEFFKLESKQFYQEDAFVEFQRTSKHKFKETFNKIEKDMLSIQSKLWEVAKKKNINLMRVHIIDLPITEYLEFEIITYKISQKYGENIFMITTEEFNKLKLSKNIEDFILFDKDNLIIHHYDENGHLLYSLISEENDDLKPFIHIKEILMKNSMSLNRFMAKYELFDNDKGNQVNVF